MKQTREYIFVSMPFLNVHAISNRDDSSVTVTEFVLSFKKHNLSVVEFLQDTIVVM